jgi:hypothetical protein
MGSHRHPNSVFLPASAFIQLDLRQVFQLNLYGRADFQYNFQSTGRAPKYDQPDSNTQIDQVSCIKKSTFDQQINISGEYQPPCVEEMQPTACQISIIS